MGTSAVPTRIPPYGAPPGARVVPGGGGGGSSIPAPPLASQGGPVIRYPPDVFPIPSAQEINTEGQAATVVAEANIELVGARIQLPQGSLGRLASIVLYVANLGAGSILSFTITINGGAVQGYTNVPIFPGATARLGVGYQPYIRIPSGALVQAFYTNADGGAYTVGVALSGWQWSQQDGDRWLASGT